MEGYQDPAKHTAPEVNRYRDGSDEDGDARRLLELDRDGKDAIKREGNEDSGADYRYAYPEPDPQRPGNRLA